MQAERAAHWVVYTAPLIAIYLIWTSYDKLIPKLFWTGIIVISYFLLPAYGFASVSFIILLIHIFVSHMNARKKTQEEADRINEQVLEAIKNNNKNLY